MMTLEECKAVIRQFSMIGTYKANNFRFGLNDKERPGYVTVEAFMDIVDVEQSARKPNDHIHGTEHLLLETLNYEQLVSHLFTRIEECLMHELGECFVFAGLRPANPHAQGGWMKLRDYRVCGAEADVPFEIPEAEIEEFDPEAQELAA